MNPTQFFKDGDGQFSSMRLAFLLWVAGLFAVWAYTSIHNKTMAPIDPSLLTLMGILTGGKVVQSGTENLAPKP